MLAQLSSRLAPVPSAPPGIVKSLGSHDDPEVAAPILTQSLRLADDDLVEIAKTKGQGHLLAISRRRSLEATVTDALVERGDQNVVRVLARNNGARFSERGFGGLVERSQGDDVLAEAVGARRDLPRDQFAKLISAASATVQYRLAAINPHLADEIGEIVSRIAAESGDGRPEPPIDYNAAKIAIDALRKVKKLDQQRMAAFANEGRFQELVVGLASCCDVPIEVVERAFFNPLTEPLLILVKAAGFNWETTRCVMRRSSSWRTMPPDRHDGVRLEFHRLQMATAQRVLRFYKVRQVAAQGG